ncbi:hypothetical protein C9374_013532 [Naegleria lovaniensis]|uniref:Uncharacterized protein n=1 Tax=Naegleria lovaniensis TaxID=51637 RepID=A0AA88KQ81_NAELO|nr:uncharacterized protein C9374_013532 [Naegleria lovaniensis]KAG2392047.1 hypothetical protein C9374_013532 [Naegleria lovaniensis]
MLFRSKCNTSNSHEKSVILHLVDFLPNLNFQNCELAQKNSSTHSEHNHISLSNLTKLFEKLQNQWTEFSHFAHKKSFSKKFSHLESIYVSQGGTIDVTISYTLQSILLSTSNGCIHFFELKKSSLENGISIITKNGKTRMNCCRKLLGSVRFNVRYSPTFVCVEECLDEYLINSNALSNSNVPHVIVSCESCRVVKFNLIELLKQAKENHMKSLETSTDLSHHNIPISNIAPVWSCEKFSLPAGLCLWKDNSNSTEHWFSHEIGNDESNAQNILNSKTFVVVTDYSKKQILFLNSKTGQVMNIFDNFACLIRPYDVECIGENEIMFIDQRSSNYSQIFVMKFQQQPSNDSQLFRKKMPMSNEKEWMKAGEGKATTKTSPKALVYDKISQTIIMSDLSNDSIKILTKDGNCVLTSFGTTGDATSNSHFTVPQGLFLDQFTGELFVCDYHNQRVQIFQ